MTAFRFPGPICTTRHWGSLEDGTLARMPTPTPSSTGLSQPLPPPPVRASGDCAYLNPVPSGTVAAPAAVFTRLRLRCGQATISASQPVADQRWPNGLVSPAESQTVQIEGQSIRVIRPVPDDAIGKNLPTTEQVAEALRAIPANQRRHSSTVTLCPVAHPDSTNRRTIAGDAGSGNIFLYPVRAGQTQNDFDNRLMHEAGHNYQGKLWNSGAAVAQWGTVATADNRRPSPYAAEGVGEDFCEFLILFNAARRTACESVAVQMYPHRWAKMLEYESG